MNFTSLKSMTGLLLIAFAIVVAACSQSGNKEAQEAPVEEESPVTIVAEEVIYSTDGATMKGFLAKSATIEGKRPGILVIHEWWGHNEHARQRAMKLADLGYTALAVDMYGDGKTADHPNDAGQFASSIMGNMTEAKARFDKALETLKADPSVDADKIGVIGYCFGGTLALTMANLGADVDAVVAFHAGLALPVMPKGKVDAKVLVCNGAADPFITPDEEGVFVAAMDAANADYKLINYEGAVHAFTNPGADSLGEKFSLPLKYQQAADEQSWAEMQKLFNSVFNK